MLCRIEITNNPSVNDIKAEKLLQQFHSYGYTGFQEIQSSEIYLFDSKDIKNEKELTTLAEAVFVDPVLTTYQINTVESKPNFDWYIEIGFLPGVTDNAARVVKENLALYLGKSQEDTLTASAKGFWIKGIVSQKYIEEAFTSLVMNKLIERYTLISCTDWENNAKKLWNIPHFSFQQEIKVESFPCNSVEQILKLSETRLLALSKEEAQTITSWFYSPSVLEDRKKHNLPENPTDVELEAIAQTWSEHCKHKIFNSHITYEDENGNVKIIDSLYKQCIKKATYEIIQKLGDDNWCLSVFKDNAGVMAFTDSHAVAFKVETHNSPSALDPYGGALTGIVGVNRDAFGTGMGGWPIANTDVFCFAPLNYNKPIPKRLLPPQRIFDGVRLGVEHGGNQSGIPTVNGAIVFDECFLGKPLVFCGTVSLLETQHHNQPGYENNILPNDAIVMVGGKIGKDGIHGATFSSLALDESSPVSAVQIGDPITQKRMWDFLWQAKKENLYRGMTDNGAGGLSSSIGEMAEKSNGAQLFLDKAPLKYAGLQPWEILVSEAQERMSLAIDPKKLPRFLELSKQMGVESTYIGTFTDSGYFECFFNNKLVARLNLDFLHNGLPQIQLTAKWSESKQNTVTTTHSQTTSSLLQEILARPNVCSKESVIRQYDHEVQGQSVIKPLMGRTTDAPCDAAVIRPLLDEYQGLVISNGICPKFSSIDTYHMAANAIDEAIRNIIAVGGSMKQIAGLDNFCWTDPIKSRNNPNGEHKLAQLVRACEAVYEYCIAFNVPCISGKDSMKNDTELEGKKISILPTLLFSAIGIIPDIRKAVTSYVKTSGDKVYVLGETYDECGSSEYYSLLNIKEGQVPHVNAKQAKERYEKLHESMQKRWITSCHDCSDGGLLTACAEITFGENLGLSLDLTNYNKTNLDFNSLCFSETASRFVVSVPPSNQKEFEAYFASDCHYIGTVQQKPSLDVTYNKTQHISLTIADLKKAWKQL